MRTFNPAEEKWRAIAEKASKEQDPQKLLALVEQLLEASKPEPAAHQSLKSKSAQSTFPHPRH